MIEAINGMNKAQRRVMTGLAKRAAFLERRLEEIEAEIENSDETEMYMMEMYGSMLRSYSYCVKTLFDAIPEDGA